MRLGTGRRARQLAALVIGLWATSCVDEPDVVTCERFDSYLSICYFSCVAGWDCEYNYRAASADMQLTLNHCSECLEEQAALGCADCTAPQGDSCQTLLDESLGLICDW